MAFVSFAKRGEGLLLNGEANEAVGPASYQQIDPKVQFPSAVPFNSQQERKEVGQREDFPGPAAYEVGGTIKPPASFTDIYDPGAYYLLGAYNYKRKVQGYDPLTVNNRRQGDKTDLPWAKHFESPGVGSYNVGDTESKPSKLAGVVLSQSQQVKQAKNVIPKHKQVGNMRKQLVLQEHQKQKIEQEAARGPCAHEGGLKPSRNPDCSAWSKDKVERGLYTSRVNKQDEEFKLEMAQLLQEKELSRLQRQQRREALRGTLSAKSATLKKHMAQTSVSIRSDFGGQEADEMNDLDEALREETNPGPGAYGHQSMFRTVSVPQKLQFFGSTQERLKTEGRKAPPLGPGQYNVTGDLKQANKYAQPSRTFKGPKRIVADFMGKTGPAPDSYAPPSSEFAQASGGVPKFERQERFAQPASLGPGPGKYNLHLKLADKLRGQKQGENHSMFKSRSARLLQPPASEPEDEELGAEELAAQELDLEIRNRKDKYVRIFKENKVQGKPKPEPQPRPKERSVWEEQAKLGNRTSREVPGPGNYERFPEEGRPEVGPTKGSLALGSPVKHLVQKLEQNPGFVEYSVPVKSSVVKRHNQGGCRNIMGVGQRFGSLKKERSQPGPGHYSPAQTWEVPTHNLNFF